MPCALPFKYNNKWFYECTAEGRDDHLLWCATSTHYDDTKKWGFCPVQGEKGTTDACVLSTYGFFFKNIDLPFYSCIMLTFQQNRFHLPTFFLCLLPFTFVTVCADYSCDHFWETNQRLQACYQFNLYTILTWSQAQSTCQAQGGNLLSVTSLAEHRYIRGRHLIREHAVVLCTMQSLTWASWNYSC